MGEEILKIVVRVSRGDIGLCGLWWGGSKVPDASWGSIVPI
jgi:hypothetical protein